MTEHLFQGYVWTTRGRAYSTATSRCFVTIRYYRWFALENWQASCQFNLSRKL